MRVTLHLTRRCNLACTYCYADCVLPSHPADMSAEVVRLGVDLAFAGRGSPQIGFFGGEPTLRLDLIEAATAHAATLASERGVPVAFEVTTNGTRVNKRFIDLVHRFHMVLAVSVDGPPDVHDVHRRTPGGGGSSGLLTRNLDTILKEVPWAVAFSVVTPETAPRLHDSVAWLFERGFRTVVTWPDHSARWTRRDLDVLRSEMERVSELYLRLAREGRRFFLSSLDGAMRAHIRGDRGACGAGRDHLSVGPSGRIYPCVQFVGDETDDRFVLGDVWRGLPAPACGSLEEPAAPCTDCALLPRCASACPCASLTATGDPRKMSPIQCALQQISIPVADRVAETLYAEENPAFLHKHYNPLHPLASVIASAIQGDPRG